MPFSRRVKSAENETRPAMLPQEPGQVSVRLVDMADVASEKDASLVG